MKQMQTKSPWIAAIISWLVPGLGHFYAGKKVSMALSLYVLFWIILLSFRCFAFTFTSLVVILVCGLLFTIGIIISAFIATRKHRSATPRKWDKWYIYLILIILHGAVLTFTPFLQNGYAPISNFSIPTSSMHPAVQIDDRIICQKQKTVDRNDLTVFKMPRDRQTFYIKRCAAVPGDTLSVENTRIWVNGKETSQDYTVQLMYLVVLEENIPLKSITDKLNITESSSSALPNTYMVWVSSEIADKLALQEGVEKVELMKHDKGIDDGKIFPQSNRFAWNVDYFGPLYIPQKGRTIPLYDETLALYEAYIREELGSGTLDITDLGVFINGEATTEYTFQKNYYFMMGDNRHNAYDSRYWGLVPEELLYGKALYIYWANDRGRIGKSLH